MILTWQWMERWILTGMLFVNWHQICLCVTSVGVNESGWGGVSWWGGSSCFVSISIIRSVFGSRWKTRALQGFYFSRVITHGASARGPVSAPSLCLCACEITSDSIIINRCKRKQTVWFILGSNKTIKTPNRLFLLLKSDTSELIYGSQVTAEKKLSV